jgi:DHA1 family bicyclomycin/chloramphenicol resistance-like MFS transporter
MTTDLRSDDRTAAAPNPLTTRLLVVLALLAAVAPFATDLYLSAFPRMADDLQTDATSIQLTLTAFLLGIAVGQLIFGPLSDRFGRRGPLIIGAAVFVLSSLAAAFAPTIATLIVARLVQGLSGAAGMVLGRAVIADIARGQAATKAFALMMVVSGVAPVLAPLLGGLMVEGLGWRGVLGALVVLAVVMLLAVLLAVPETLPRTARGGDESRGWRALASRRYLGVTAAFVLAFSVMMAYISASPFVYQRLTGLDEVQYGLLFGLNALGLMVSSALAPKLTSRLGDAAVLRTGLVGVLLSCLVLLALVLAGAPAAWLPVPIFAAITSLGLVLGTSTAIALGAVTGAAGTASAVLGAAQFLLAAVVTPLVGLAGETSAVPMAAVMTTAAVLALVAFAASGAGRTPHD